MILRQRGVSQLNADRVVHSNENEEQCVCHKVFLAIVTKRFVVLTSLFVYLNRVSVNRLVAFESYGEPDGDPSPVA